MLRIHLKVILKNKFHLNLFVGQGSVPAKLELVPSPKPESPSELR